MGFTAFRSSSRIWMFIASLATRGAGFITSFLIARLAGASALGAYSALVNTASSVAIPFAQVLTNNSTLLGAEAVRNHGEKYRKYARDSLILALFLSLLSILALFLLFKFMLVGNAVDSPFLLLVGSIVVICQLVGGVGLGFLYGAGEFIKTSWIAIVAAIVTCFAAYPMIAYYGLPGALTLLLFISLFPSILMIAQVFMRKSVSYQVGDVREESMNAVLSKFFRALPTVAAISVNNGVNWVCTIYLVQLSFGSVGVGVIAVAGQWLNLMLIPATSWGGVSLKALTDSLDSSCHNEAWNTAYRLMRKNLGITLALSGVIALASGVIAQAYGLQDTEVALLICINAACALIASVNNIFERFLLALDRQTWWLLFSLASFSVQMIITFLFISKGLWMVSSGVFLAGIILSVLSYFGVQSALTVKKERK